MANGSGQIPVIECARSAWQFLLTNARRFAPAAFIVALVAEIGPTIALLTGSPEPQATSALTANIGQIVMMLPGIFASLMFTAAVLRLAVRDQFAGPTGLTIGADEIRLLGVLAGLLCIIVPFGTLVYLIVSVVVLSRLASTPAELQALFDDPEAMSKAVDAALGPAGSAAFLIFIVVVTVAAIYTAIRLFMINAATIGERRVVMFQTWKWSRGNVSRMFTAILLAWLPASLVDTIIYGFAVNLLNAVVTEGNAAYVIPLFRIITTFISLMLTLPTIAIGAVLYKGLRPADFVAK